MPVELLALAGVVFIQFLLIMAQQAYNDVRKGLMWALSNREDQDLDETSLRLARALRNHVENTAIFAPLALAIVAIDGSTWWTQTGALVFLGARAAYAVLYGLGIPYVRSMAWMVGVIGYWIVGWPFVRAALGW